MRASYGFSSIPMGEDREQVKSACCYSWRGVAIRSGSGFGALVPGKNGIIVARQCERQIGTPADARKRSRGSPKGLSKDNAPRILWRGGRSSRCRSVLLWPTSLRLLSISALLLGSH